MSKQHQRYQRILESIPCYPDSISTSSIRDQLLSADLISASATEKSQLRTIQRDINQIMSENHSVEVNDKNRPYQYQIAQGHRHPIRPDGMSSVVSLQVIEEEIKSMLPPTLRAAVDTVFSSLKQENTKQTKLWNERFCYFHGDYPLIAPHVNDNFFKIIEEALLNKKDIAFTYQKRGAREPKSYTLTPLGLFLNGNTFYLVGLIPETVHEFRIFALHRISTLKLSYSSITSLKAFNIKKYVQQNARHFSGGEIQTVILKIDNHLGLHLLEGNSLSETQSIISTDEKYTTIRADIRDSHTFDWWLMKYANVVEVLEPVAIRERMIKAIKKSMALYGL